jgi:hypothetical protein
MHRLITATFGVVLSCVSLATAEAQSPAVPPAPAQTPSYSVTVAPPAEGSTQRDLKIMVPDGAGGLTELPQFQDVTKVAPGSSDGSVLIVPPDPQILPPDESNTTGPER